MGAFMEAMDEFLEHGGSKCLAEPKLKRMDALFPTVQDTSQSKKTLKLVYTGCQVAKKESKVSFAESMEKFIEEFWALKPDKLLKLDDTAATNKIYVQYGKMKPGNVYSPRRRVGTRKPLAKEERYLKSLLSMKLKWANHNF